MTIVPISALEHFSYCPRQCALIHLEGVFLENLWTAEGSAAHRRVDSERVWKSGGAVRGLVVFSDVLGVIGRADLVEIQLGGVPFPVEYKNAHWRQWRHEEIQLCAQALCLEEMFEVSVPVGAVYYARSRRRREVVLGTPLRKETLDVISATRSLLDGANVPRVRPAPRCRRCSLRPACLPEVTGRPRAAALYEAALRHLPND